MGLLSLFKNNMQKQEIPEDADSGEFHSRAEQEDKPGRANGKRATPNASVPRSATLAPSSETSTMAVSGSPLAVRTVTRNDDPPMEKSATASAERSSSLVATAPV